MNKEEIFEEIKSFQVLEFNWDGYGGQPPSEVVCNNTIKLIELLGDHVINGLIDFFPEPNGTITLIWKNSNLTSNSIQVGVGESTFSWCYYNDYLYSEHRLDINRYNIQNLKSKINYGS